MMNRKIEKIDIVGDIKIMMNGEVERITFKLDKMWYYDEYNFQTGIDQQKHRDSMYFLKNRIMMWSRSF